MMSEHWLVSLSLLLLTVAFVFGVSLGITNPKIRNLARLVSFLPPIVAFVVLRPASFGKQIAVQLSTSQWIGLLSACICAYFYAQFWETARRSPKLAMGLESLGDVKPTEDDLAPRRRKAEDEDEDEHDDEEQSVAAKPKKKKGKKKSAVEAPAEDAAPTTPATDEDAPDEQPA